MYSYTVYLKTVSKYNVGSDSNTKNVQEIKSKYNTLPNSLGQLYKVGLGLSKKIIGDKKYWFYYKRKNFFGHNI